MNSKKIRQPSFKNSQRLALFGAPIAIGVIAMTIGLLSPPKNPIYEGRPMLEWLKDAGDATMREPPEILRQNSDTAIPALIKLLAAEPAPIRDDLIKFLRRQTNLARNYSTVEENRQLAKAGLRAFGDEAMPALLKLLDHPELLYEDNHPAFLAAKAISGMGAEAYPALVDALSHDSSYVRYNAVMVLGLMRSSIREEVFTSPLLTLLRDPEWFVRARAAITPYEFDSENKAIEKALAEALEDPHSAVRHNAALILRRFAHRNPRTNAALKQALERENEIEDRLSEPGIIGRKSRADIARQINLALETSAE